MEAATIYKKRSMFFSPVNLFSSLLIYFLYPKKFHMLETSSIMR